MTLDELIERLEKEDPALVVENGFGNPHSYRGYYERVAFEPVARTTIGDMLREAKSALGATYCGWKGGEYVMHGFTGSSWSQRYANTSSLVHRPMGAQVFRVASPPSIRRARSPLSSARTPLR